VQTHTNVAHGVHTHNNGARGVRSIGRAQRNFVGARAMWVYVVAQVNGLAIGAWWGRTKIWHGAMRRVKCTRNISM
jgi:hypothetical protein